MSVVVCCLLCCYGSFLICWLNIVVFMFVCRAMCVFIVAWFVMRVVRCALFVGCSLLLFVG